MYKIISKETLNENVEKMVVEAPFIAKKCGAGQFIMVMVEEEGERIPLTIADYNREENTITIIYQIVGASTKLLSLKKAGDTVFALAGPMGKKVHIEEGAKRVLGIAGGVGAAPIFPQLRELKDAGVEVDLILGARNKDYIILEDDFKTVTNNRYICTDDGSYGTKGFVTDKLKELVANDENTQVNNHSGFTVFFKRNGTDLHQTMGFVGLHTICSQQQYPNSESQSHFAKQ
jgi:NAD(P)H-flavin reductase